MRNLVQASGGTFLPVGRYHSESVTAWLRRIAKFGLSVPSWYQGAEEEARQRGLVEALVFFNEDGPVYLAGDPERPDGPPWSRGHFVPQEWAQWVCRLGEPPI